MSTRQYPTFPAVPDDRDPLQRELARWFWEFGESCDDPRTCGSPFRPPLLRHFIYELWKENGKPGLEKAAEAVALPAPKRFRPEDAGGTRPNSKIRP